MTQQLKEDERKRVQERTFLRQMAACWKLAMYFGGQLKLVILVWHAVKKWSTTYLRKLFLKLL